MLARLHGSTQSFIKIIDLGRIKTSVSFLSMKHEKAVAGLLALGLAYEKTSFIG